MKIGIIVFALVALLFSTSCRSEYLIEGSSSVSRLDGKMLFVKISDGERMINIDSAEVVHGLFRMQGEVDSAFIASLYMDDQSIMPLVVERGNIQIKIDNGRIVASGTPLNEKLYDFVEKKITLDNLAYEMERKGNRMIMDGTSIDVVEQELSKGHEKLSKELDSLVKTFIKDNYENALGPGMFIMMVNGFPYPMMTPLVEELVNEAPESFKSNNLVKKYMDAAKQNTEKLNAGR